MFDKLFNDIERKHDEFKGIEREEVHFFDNPLIYPTLYEEKLKNINSMDQMELYKIVSASLGTILDNIERGENDYDDIKYFQNKRFLETVVNVCARTRLEMKDIRNLNKIVYEYMTSKLPNLPLKELMVDIVRNADRDLVNNMVNMTGMSDEDALYICVSFFSVSDNLKAILKMNMAIMRLPKDIATEQNIIFIYEAFSEYIRMSNLFKSIMFDFGIQMDSKKSEIFSMMIIAVLSILNAQKLDVIRLVLIEYVNSYNYPTPACQPVRFTIYSISQEDYDRIMYVVGLLRGEEIFVP